MLTPAVVKAETRNRHRATGAVVVVVIAILASNDAQKPGERRAVYSLPELFRALVDATVAEQESHNEIPEGRNRTGRETAKDFAKR